MQQPRFNFKKGVCINGDGEVFGNRTVCDDCKEKKIALATKRYQDKRITNGLCRICGAKRETSARYCEKHREIEAKRSLKIYHDNMNILKEESLAPSK